VADQAKAPPEVPAELRPKGAGKATPEAAGAKARPGRVVLLDEEAATRAWLGLWAILRFVVWAAGRWFVRPDQEARLAALAEREARADAASLLPAFRVAPGISTAISYLGGPLAMAVRVRDKLEVVPRVKKPRAEEGKDAAEPARPT
jgi:hypothetical protein